MHVLILGGGGREHALAWKIAQSPLVRRLTVAPGNAGIAALADCVALPIEDGAAVAAWARRNAVDLVVIGPEAPLAAGVADALAAAGVAAFGPSAAAARLEASKAFTKEVCDACGAPTARWARFSDREAALRHLQAVGAPVVVKADGLAAGKGVVVAETLAEAEAAVDAMLGGAFGAAGAEVVIEERLEGEEASFFVLTDGCNVLPLGDGAGSQARLRRRPGPEHRRDGRLLARPRHDAADRGAGARRDRPPDHRRDGAPGHALSRGALCRADDRRRRGRSSSSTMSASAIRSARR